MLPPFRPGILNDLEEVAAGSASKQQQSELSWLLDGRSWRRERKDLPHVIILRSDGPVFSSGHDLAELRTLSHDQVKETFALCAEVMSMIRRSPAPVVGVVQGLATAAGCQLALTTDIPIACGSTNFQLPGASIGLPCTSPSTAVSRRLGAAFTYRMLALAEPVRADELPNGAVEVVSDTTALEERVAQVVRKLSEQSGAQSQALGKWAYWTQLSLRGSDNGGDGYEDAVSWAGRMMALHARSDDATEGISAFFEKRKPFFDRNS
jgi:enoyl-CoA hydratase/carnithine racemase